MQSVATTTPKVGDILTVEWCGNDRPVRARLVARYEHPAGNGWRVNIYDPRGGRFSKVEQAIGDEAIRAAIARAEGGAA